MSVYAPGANCGGFLNTVQSGLSANRPGAGSGCRCHI